MSQSDSATSARVSSNDPVDPLLLAQIESCESAVTAYFTGADHGIDRSQRLLHMLLRAAREGNSWKLLRDAQAVFADIRVQLDPAGGPSKVKSLRVH